MKTSLFANHPHLAQIALATAVLLAAVTGLAAPESPGGFATDFSAGAEAWTLVSGSFRVENGGYRGNAMEEINKLTRTVVGDPAWSDYRATARVKLDKTANTHADFGVIARYQDLKNYYMVLYKTGVKKCTIEAKLNGKLRTLAEAPCELEAARWHEIQFTVSGSHLALVIDGRTVVEAEDTNLATGTAGLLAYYVEVTCTRFVVEPSSAP